MHVRSAVVSDLPEIRRIQQSAWEAAQWDVSDYLLLVAEIDGQVAGFLAWRNTAPDEAELLNLAVAPGFRRRGIALALIAALHSPNIFLEVRESNSAARALYRKAGFIEAGVRSGYYSHPAESAVVMRLQS